MMIAIRSTALVWMVLAVAAPSRLDAFAPKRQEGQSLPRLRQETVLPVKTVRSTYHDVYWLDEEEKENDQAALDDDNQAAFSNAPQDPLLPPPQYQSYLTMPRRPPLSLRSSSSSSSSMKWSPNAIRLADDQDDTEGGLFYNIEAENNDNAETDDAAAAIRYERPIGEAIALGEAVLCLPGVVSAKECDYLRQQARSACRGRGFMEEPRNRLSVSDPTAFDYLVLAVCDQIMLRILEYLDQQAPSIAKKLFLPAHMETQWSLMQPHDELGRPRWDAPLQYLSDMTDSLRELYTMGELEWAEGEPAVNVYEVGGYCGAHKDHLALSILIPLSSEGSEFEGGGTAFWKGGRATDSNPQGPPDLVLTPQAGSALIYGGDVTHAGLPVTSGTRCVFVCSFSTRTPYSPEHCLHGLQGPPTVSPDFKGGSIWTDSKNPR